MTVYSEFAYMYYDNLLNKAHYDTSGYPQQGWGLQNTGDFANLRTWLYWSGTQSALNTSCPFGNAAKRDRSGASNAAVRGGVTMWASRRRPGRLG